MKQVHRKWLASFGILAASLVVVYCAPADGPAAPRTARLATGVMPSFSKALPHATHNVGWVGDLHTKAMQDLMGNRAEWSNPAHGSLIQRKCKELSRLAAKYSAILGRQAGLEQGSLDAAARAALVREGCDGTQPMMVWRIAASSTVAQNTTDDYTTGAFMNYVPGLEDAMNYAEGPEDAASGMDAVIASASGLSSADLEVLEGIASLGESSAYYWYDQESSGALDSLRIEQPMSIFSTSMHITWWGKVGWADLSGIVTTVAKACKWTDGLCVEVPEGTLAAGALGGIISSGSAAIAAI